MAWPTQFDLNEPTTLASAARAPYAVVSMADEDEHALAKRSEAGVADPYERQYMQGKGMVLHRAKQRAPSSLTALLGGISLVSVLPVFLGVPGAWIGAVLSLPIMFAVWVLFSVLRVTVSEGSVDVQYGVFGPSIPTAAIESAVPTTYQWTRYGGWGIRRGPQGEWLYNMPGDGGNAVRVKWRDAKGRPKVTLIGAKDNQRLANAIAEARRALPSRDEPDALPPST